MPDTLTPETPEPLTPETLCTVLLHRLNNADNEPIAVPAMYALMMLRGAHDLGVVKSLSDPRILAATVLTADQIRTLCHTWLDGIERDARGDDVAPHEARVQAELAASKSVAARTVATLRKMLPPTAKGSSPDASDPAERPLHLCPPVHLCDWADQPDIHLLCTDTWTQPAWPQPECGPDLAHVYLAATGARYAFDETYVTCPACRASRSALQPGTDSQTEHEV